jgi:hypothetical protein
MAAQLGSKRRRAVTAIAASLVALTLVACLETQPGLLVPKPLGLNPFDGNQGGTQRLAPPKPASFSICHGHTCRFIAHAGFSFLQWQAIETAFVLGLDSAEREREILPSIIGMMETIVGAQTGTGGDLAENHSRHGESGQMDCIDESSNTLTYLTLLDNANLLRWHRVGTRLNRGPYTLVMQAPHSAAEMIELATGARYAVDSWFGSNGQPAMVVSQAEWSRGYRPPRKSRFVVPVRPRVAGDRPQGW